MDINYNSMNFILSNAIKPTYALPVKMNLSLEEYIKSQVHFPLMGYVIPERNIDEYLKAYEYITKYDKENLFYDDFFRVSRYFYQDISSSIKNAAVIPDGFDFTVSVGAIENIPTVYIDSKSLDSEGRELWKSKIDYLENNMNHGFIEMR